MLPGWGILYIVLITLLSLGGRKVEVCHHINHAVCPIGRHNLVVNLVYTCALRIWSDKIVSSVLRISLSKLSKLFVSVSTRRSGESKGLSDLSTRTCKLPKNIWHKSKIWVVKTCFAWTGPGLLWFVDWYTCCLLMLKTFQFKLWDFKVFELT